MFSSANSKGLKRYAIIYYCRVTTKYYNEKYKNNKQNNFSILTTNKKTTKQGKHNISNFQMWTRSIHSI